MAHSKNCHCCEGSGKEIDQKQLGLALSGLRLRSGIGLRDMARRVGISHTYLKLLEKGDRVWTSEIRSDYQFALETSLDK